jgi:hypothetical protein
MSPSPEVSNSRKTATICSSSRPAASSSNAATRQRGATTARKPPSKATMPCAALRVSGAVGELDAKSDRAVQQLGAKSGGEKPSRAREMTTAAISQQEIMGSYELVPHQPGNEDWHVACGYTWIVACGRWPMVRRKAVSSATRLCGASSTRYVSMRGLIGSRRVPPTHLAPVLPVYSVSKRPVDFGSRLRANENESEKKLYGSLDQRDERSVMA